MKPLNKTQLANLARSLDAKRIEDVPGEPVEKIAVSKGKHGINAAIVRGTETGTFYHIDSDGSLLMRLI